MKTYVEVRLLSTVEKILFCLLAAGSIYFSFTGFKQIIFSVGRGDRGYFPRLNQMTERLGEAIARTISQVTVFKARPVASFFHSFIFYGFTYYLLVNVFDGLKGFLPEQWLNGFNFGLLGKLYRLSADVLSVLIIIGVGFFLIRRFIAQDKRLEFNPSTPLHEKVKLGGIRRDSLIVGIFIILHVGFRLLGEGFLLAAEGHHDAWQPFASAIANTVGYGESRIVGWHIGWWGALGLILCFLPYFPRSKHIHLFAAPLNFAFERRSEKLEKVPLGALEPINFEDENLSQYGVERLEQLRFPQILDAYACIQCNRCANVCPAQSTGKALAPAALEINKRYEMNDILSSFAKGDESPRALLDFALDESSLWACTTCGACMEVCPVGCEQMIDIIDIRRNQVMMEGSFPEELSTAFRGMERNGNPWGIGQDKRDAWRKEVSVPVPTVDENPDFEVLFWVGCAGSYDPAAQSTTKAMAHILNHARINFAILGKGEKCTGDSARRAGNEYLYYQLATENVMVLNEVLIEANLDSSKKKRIVTTCPHCFNALFNDYPQLGGDYEVVHHSQLIEELMQAGRIPPLSNETPITYHDPCYLGRHNGIYDAPRNVLQSSGYEILEMPNHRSSSFCCGAGGAQFWKEEEEGTMRVSEKRYQEAKATGAKLIAAGCPFCKVMLKSSDSAQEEAAPEVLDIAQIVWQNMQRIEQRLGL
ncbi:MAG: (Fe-S)-binding protein [Deinococcales bacterium]